MNVHLYRIFVSAIVFCALTPVIAEAQKKNLPVDKPKSGSRIPADNKSNPNDPSPSNFSSLELAVVEEMNSARSEPQKFVVFLNEYKKSIKGNLIALPGHTPLRTIEGAPVLDEAIGEMKLVSNLESFEVSRELADAARMQLKDLQEDAALGHKGKNGSTLKMRLAQFVAVRGKSAENICFRGKTAREVVMTFLIDDGVKSRMHRRNVLSPLFKKIGVACGVGKNNDSLCVAVFTEDYKELNADSKHVEF